MGYFGGLQKCARYYDGTAYRWGAWVNTGSAAAGADYAAEDGLCVVYRAQAYYTGGESALLPLSVATNFINPQSTGNPSTACCYLYTFDPTNGGDARISAPPAGYAASAGPAAFSASVVGSYISFGFPAPEGKPAALYFWFTSAGSYAGFGSNQIYHYATGNWSGTLQTGTRTPAISGGFSGQGGSGGGGGGETGVDAYSVKDCGSAMNIAQSARSFTMSMGRAQVGRMKVSFAYTAQADICASAAGSAQLSYLWLSDGPEIDPANGHPVSILRAIPADGAVWTERLEKGRTYYIFAMCGGALTAGSVSFTVTPPAAVWSVGDSGEYIRPSAAVERSISLGEGKYSVVKLIFAGSGTAEIHTGGTEMSDGQRIEAYFAENDALDTSYGDMESFIAYANGDESAGPPELYMSCAVISGRTYYLITKNSYSSAPLTTALKTTVHITPPPAHTGGYTLTDEEDALMLRAALSCRTECAPYTVLRRRLSFRYAGTAEISAAALDGSVPEMRGYVTDSAQIDLETGVPGGVTLAHSGEAAESFVLSFQAEKGEEYWLYTVIARVDMADACRLALLINCPEAPAAGTEGLVRIAAGGEARCARAYIFRQGEWHTAVPMCCAGGEWRTCG